MAQPKFTLYKYVKLQGGWRYCKATFHDNVKTSSATGLTAHLEERNQQTGGTGIAPYSIAYSR
jgi:hypothetical protein